MNKKKEKGREICTNYGPSKILNLKVFEEGTLGILYSNINLTILLKV